MSSDLTAWLYKQFYNRCIGTALPLSWFTPTAPTVDSLSTTTGRLQIELVTHCWKYAHLAVYQLSSLVNYPAPEIDLTYTFFYAEEDASTVRLIEHFGAMNLPNITWNWQRLSPNQLYRRSIGRNLAAQASRANWVWFVDCDLIFHQRCLSSLASVLPGKRHRLVYPQSEHITDMLPADHPLVNLDPAKPTLVDIDPAMFHPRKIVKATGAFQIVHGDVARTCGYCSQLGFFQRPTDHWRKTFEDSIFRRLIEDQGTPLPIEGLHRIRHREKGRYSSTARISQWRKEIRRLTDGRNQR